MGASKGKERYRTERYGRSMRTFVPADAKLIPEQATRVFHGVIFEVYHWQQKMYDGSTKVFERLKRPDSVQIIAIKDEKIVVLEQEQPDVGFFYSLPSGRHDVESEDELQAAKRELLEETGMTFSSWRLVSAAQPYSKIDWLIYTFLATDFICQQEQQLDAGEKITVTLKTLEEVKELNQHPKVRDLARDIFDGIHSMQELVHLPGIE